MPDHLVLTLLCCRNCSDSAQNRLDSGSEWLKIGRFVCLVFRRFELHAVIVTLNDSLCAFLRADVAVVPRKHPH